MPRLQPPDWSYFAAAWGVVGVGLLLFFMTAAIYQQAGVVLIVLGLLLVVYSLRPCFASLATWLGRRHRMRVSVSTTEEPGPDARIAVLNEDKAGKFFARAEILAGGRKGRYQPPWIEDKARDISLPYQGSAHLLLATTDASLRDKHSLVELIVWQMTSEGRERWDSMRWNVPDDRPAGVVLSVTLGRCDEGEALYKPKEWLMEVKGSLYGGCSVRIINSDEHPFPKPRRRFSLLRRNSYRHRVPIVFSKAATVWGDDPKRQQRIGGSYGPGEVAGFPREIAEQAVAEKKARFYRRRDKWVAAYRSWRQRQSGEPLPPPDQPTPP